MKYLFSILLLLHISCYASHIDTINYASMMESYITTWEKNCINHLMPDEIITITEIIILSYQIFQASITMAQTKLDMQLELFSIVTLSINDSFEMILHAQKNDLTKIKDCVTTIENAQEKIKKACDLFKNFGPLLISINPTTIKIFIENLKNIILDWITYQIDFVHDFKIFQESLLQKTMMIDTIETIFTTITHTYPKDLTLVLQGTNILTENYKNIEEEFAHFTHIRKNGIIHLNKLLTLFFKYHYEILYEHIQKIAPEKIIFQSTFDNKLPNPEKLFTIA
jgi:hypothetical protein